MTNEEAISVLIKTKVMCVSGKVTEFEKAQRLAYQSLEENDKLKAYIARLNGELKSEREWRYNARIELLDKKSEIDQLKSELEQCKNRQALSEKERMIQGLNDFCDKFEMCNQCIFYGRCADFDELSFEEIKSQLEEAEQSLKGQV